MEAAGEVIDVGEGVTGILPGDRVAYACPPVGAYAQYRTLKADQLVVLPDGIGDDVAAALMLKGMTAEYLAHAGSTACSAAISCSCTPPPAASGCSSASGRSTSARP